jgi:hypothetical protein
MNELQCVLVVAQCKSRIQIFRVQYVIIICLFMHKQIRVAHRFVVYEICWLHGDAPVRKGKVGPMLNC